MRMKQPTDCDLCRGSIGPAGPGVWDQCHGWASVSPERPQLRRTDQNHRTIQPGLPRTNQNDWTMKLEHPQLNRIAQEKQAVRQIDRQTDRQTDRLIPNSKKSCVVFAYCLDCGLNDHFERLVVNALDDKVFLKIRLSTHFLLNTLWLRAHSIREETQCKQALKL